MSTIDCGSFISAVKELHDINTDALFHYTSIQGFLLMMEPLREKKCYLFPGHLRYQNDSLEFGEGINYLKQYRGNYKQEIKSCLQALESNVFASCFSGDGDLLDQWKYYGKNCGLAIEFHFAECEGNWREANPKIDDTSTIKELVPETTTGAEPMNMPPSNAALFIEDEESIPKLSFIDTKRKTRNQAELYPISVIYDDKEKKRKRDELFRNIEANRKKLRLRDNEAGKRTVIQYTVATFVPLCKNKHFSSERESRILFLPHENTPILYREKNGRILPYIKCTVVNKDDKRYPIASVTVGPGQNQNLVFNAVINYLEGGSNAARFVDDERIQAVLRKSTFYRSFEDFKNTSMVAELGYYKRENGEKVLVYRTTNGLFVRRSPIPFRD